MLKVLKDNFTHLKLKWVLLNSSAFGPSDSKSFVYPVEIIQREIYYFRTS
jgi:hypothetical protein